MQLHRLMYSLTAIITALHSAMKNPHMTAKQLVASAQKVAQVPAAKKAARTARVAVR